MRHYSAEVQCRPCGYRFIVCVHASGLVTNKKLTVRCPDNGSLVHIPVEALVAVETCPAGAVIVKDDRA